MQVMEVYLLGVDFHLLDDALVEDDWKSWLISNDVLMNELAFIARSVFDCNFDLFGSFS